jgi:hypothetical protein
MAVNGFVPSEFRSSWWLPGPHLQTLGARALRSARGVPFARVRVDLPDGDFVDLDFPFGLDETAASGEPLVLVLHGLEGSARSTYAIETYRRLARDGVRAVGLNFRSCSGELNRLPRLYHSGDTQDLSFIVNWLKDRLPERPFGIIGFSLGGNVLLKYLGERGPPASDEIEAAVAISVPFDLSKGATHLERPGGRIYARYLLRKLIRKVIAKREMLVQRIDYDRAVGASTFRIFDDAATAKLHGFDGAEDYYRRSSSASFLREIAVTTLLIHSLDDPFLPPESVPRSAVAENPNLAASFTIRGGHVGFVSGGAPWRPAFWAESEAARFVSKILHSKSGHTIR